MSRSRIQRKNQQGFIKRDPLVFNRVINRNRPLNSQEQLEVMLPARMAFEAMRQGQYSEDDIFSLYCVIKMILKFSQTNAQEFLGACNDAQQSLAAIYQDWLKSKSLRVVTEQELIAILSGIEIYESIVASFTPDELAVLFMSIY
jgi:hypothetical protein